MLPAILSRLQQAKGEQLLPASTDATHTWLLADSTLEVFSQMRSAVTGTALLQTAMISALLWHVANDDMCNSREGALSANLHEDQ